MQPNRSAQTASPLPVWNRPYVLMLIAALAAFVAYCGTVGFQFVFDDEVVVVRNPTIQAWRFVPQYFTTVFGSHLGTGVISYYRPLFLLWFRLNHALFGLNPAGYHVTAVLVHVGVTALVFAMAARLLRDARRALLPALLYAVHPVHVENVAWISCVSETLLALLLLAAFLAWLKFRESHAPWWLAASLALYAAAALEKEPGITLPALVFFFALVYAPEAQPASARLRAAVLAVLPFLPVAAAYIILRAIATGGLLPRATTAMSFATMAMTWPSLLWFYVRSLLWPLHTSAFYDFAAVTSPGVRNFLLPLLAMLLVVAAIVVWAWRSSHRREIAFAAVWMTITIGPALYLRIFLPNDFAHVRYLYLPSVGFVLLAALALEAALQRLPSTPVRYAGIAAVCVLLAVATFAQQVYWGNNLLLYSRSVAVAPHNPTARNNLANELQERKMYTEAIAQYRTVLAEHPDFWLANYNLGAALVRVKAPEEAKVYLDRAIAIQPSDPEEHYFRGVANLELGRRQEAVQDFERAATLAPSVPAYRETVKRAREQAASR